jgi:hypothetical protein
MALLVSRTKGHDPERWDRGSHRVGWPLSQSPCRGSHPIVGRSLSGRIWSVVFVPVVNALGGVVLSALRGAWMASDRTEVTAVPSVLAGQSGMPTLVRTGVPGCA